MSQRHKFTGDSFSCDRQVLAQANVTPIFVTPAAISVKHSTHTEISVTGIDRRGMQRTRLCALLSVVSVCHASCMSYLDEFEILDLEHQFGGQSSR
mgnify:CR=1 FL=1